MKKYSLMCLPIVCAAMLPLSADVARTNQHPSKQNMQNRSMGSNEITPPAPPLVKHCADPFLSAEYIYWRTNQQGLDYAVSGIALNAGSSERKGRVYSPRMEYSSGFKVGFGLKFRHDSWDLYANYTWLRPESKKSSTTRTRWTRSPSYLARWL